MPLISGSRTDSSTFLTCCSTDSRARFVLWTMHTHAYVYLTHVHERRIALLRQVLRLRVSVQLAVWIRLAFVSDLARTLYCSNVRIHYEVVEHLGRICVGRGRIGGFGPPVTL